MSRNPRQKPGRGAKAAGRRDPLASLRQTDMLISRPLLPAEILAHIADFLAIPDLMRLARVSRRMCEMVYDDTRWVRRLRMMGAWDEEEARTKGRLSAAGQVHADRRLSTIDRKTVNGKGRPGSTAAGSHLLFDPDPDSPASPRKLGIQRAYDAKSVIANHKDDGFDAVEIATNHKDDGFDTVEIAAPGVPQTQTAGSDDSKAALLALRRVRSIRGQARQEYGKLYSAVGPFYVDTLRQQDPRKGLVFKTYETRAEQAQMLVQVRVLAQSDSSPGSDGREKRIKEAIELLDTAALLDFRQGYEYGDIAGRMRESAHVMHILNGGTSAVNLFLQDNKMIANKASLGSATDCVDYSQGWSQLSLERVQAYFDRLAVAFAEEAGVVRAVFDRPDQVLIQLLERTSEEVLAPFLAALFDDAQARAGTLYLKIISGTFAATRHFIVDNCLDPDSDELLVQRANAVVGRIYEPHLEGYLAQELETFRLKAEREIEQWNRALAEQVASTESYLMANVNRSADKKDFLSSFKQVVMAPVNLLQGFSGSSMSSKPVVHKTITNGFDTRSSTPSQRAEAPTSELAAKAALMNARLETIRSLFSIEVALNLVHSAKASIERIAQFIALGGHIGESAKSECRAIFSLLVDTVGTRHVKAGFDTAIERLESYKARDAATTNTNGNGGGGGGSDQAQVAPLTTFLELINVGDLIQQMLALFFESELVATRIVSRDDFLDASVKEKKKFEAMLDERVATGLSRGIDVLMDEIEYLYATSQAASDFNPRPVAGPDAAIIVDVGPTATANRVIELVKTHTSMLTGATEKTLLDVFTAEVGLRLFTLLCKHIKRQRISTAGAMPLISDLALYAAYIASFRNYDLNTYFAALREVAQIYLIAGSSSRDVAEMAAIIGDADRYKGVFTVEDVVEFAERRTDWLLVRAGVERRVLVKISH
ncbi:hypothetical protein DV735_g1250, partial [Chaetothyriales sp. CBS 134920]